MATRVAMPMEQFQDPTVRRGVMGISPPAPNIRTYQSYRNFGSWNHSWGGANAATSWTRGGTGLLRGQQGVQGHNRQNGRVAVLTEIHAARPTLTASAIAPRKTWTTRPEPDQVALPSGAAKSLSKVFSLSSHCPKLSPQMDSFHHLSSSFIIFHHFLHHLSSFVIGMLDSHGNSPAMLQHSEAVPARTALWGSVVHGVDVGDGWCRRWMDVLRCGAVMPWAEVMLEMVGNGWNDWCEVLKKCSRSAQEVLKKVMSQRVNISKVNIDDPESAWR